jgi:uncharacterized protein (DUF488 family)
VQRFGIGHSTHSLEQFVRLLDAHEITQIADIRTVPRSRKWPHFGSDRLTRSLPAPGIEYVHLPALGGWRRPVENSPNTGWRKSSFQGYADTRSPTISQRAWPSSAGSPGRGPQR